MKRKIRYHKPCINNLSGKKGKAILEYVRNMKAPSDEMLQEKADIFMRQILELKANGE